jgi:hypothetical protein
MANSKPGGTGLVAQQIALLARERPVSFEFFGMPVLSHGQRANRLRSSLSEQTIQAKLVIALGKYGLNRTLLQLFRQRENIRDPRTNRRDVRRKSPAWSE